MYTRGCGRLQHDLSRRAGGVDTVDDEDARRDPGERVGAREVGRDRRTDRGNVARHRQLRPGWRLVDLDHVGADWPTFPAASIAKPVTSVVPSASRASRATILRGVAGHRVPTVDDRPNRRVGERLDRDVAVGELGQRGLAPRSRPVQCGRSTPWRSPSSTWPAASVATKSYVVTPSAGDRSMVSSPCRTGSSNVDRLDLPTTMNRYRDARHSGPSPSSNARRDRLRHLNESVGHGDRRRRWRRVDTRRTARQRGRSRGRTR